MAFKRLELLIAEELKRLLQLVLAFDDESVLLYTLQICLFLVLNVNDA